MIGIESVRLIETRKNYEVIFKSLYLFDSLISGINVGSAVWKKIDSTHGQIVKHLIQSQSIDNTQGVYDDYIDNTLKAFIQNKLEINIWMYYTSFQWINDDMRNLIMHKTEMVKNIDEAESRTDGDMTNSVRTDFLNIFSNVKKITLRLCYKKKLWVISLESLISIMQQSSLDEIILVLGRVVKIEYDKLLKLYPISTDLKHKFNEANCDLSDIFIQTRGRDKEAWCVVSRK